MYTLRPYQQTGKNDTREAIRLLKGMGKPPRVLLCMPTGGGKTVLAGSIIEDAVAKEKKVLFLAHARELVNQCHEKLEGFGISNGIIMAGSDKMKRVLGAPVQVASLMTLLKRVQRGAIDKPHADLVFIDEAHRSRAESYKEVSSWYPNASFIGLSATPARTDGRGLGEFWQKIVHVASYSELIACGSLVPILVYSPDGPDLSKLPQRGGDFIRNDTYEKAVNTIHLIGDAVKWWKKLGGPERPTLVFAAGKRHAQNLRDAFNREGFNFGYVDGDMPIKERELMGRALEHGDLHGICNCQVYIEGFDCPCVKFIVDCQPTRSLIRYRQKAGRGARPFGDYTDCIYTDHCGTFDALGAPDDDVVWPLARDKKVEAVQPKNADGEPLVARSIKCKVCMGTFKAAPVCPHCGADCTSGYTKAMNVQVHEGDLKLKKRRNANAETSWEEKNRFWQKCIHASRYKRLSIGVAGKWYKDRFGVWPRDARLQHVPKGREWRMSASEFWECVVHGAPRVGR